ncbi:MAG: MFS transporter [Leptonema sp. (in: bacteria)]
MNLQLPSTIYYISFARLLLAFGYTMSYVFVPVYLSDVKKLPPSLVGLITGISSLLGLVSWFFVNFFSEKLGEKKMILVSFSIRTLVFLLSGIFIYFDFSYFYLILLLFANSFLLGLSVSPMEALIIANTNEDNRNLAFSIHRTGMNLGWALGPLLGGFLADYNYSFPFFGTFFLTLISMVLLNRWLKNEIRIQKSDSLKDNFKNFFQNRILVFFLLNSINIFIVMSLLITPLSVFLTNQHNITKVNLGKLYFLNGIMIVLFQVPVSLWTKNLFFSIQIGTLFYYLGFLSIGIFSYFSLKHSFFYLSIVIISIGELLTISSLHSLISLVAEKTNKNISSRSLNIFVSSYIGFTRTLGWSVGPVFAGWIQEFFNGQPLWIWFFSPITGLLGIGIHMYLGRKVKDFF